MANNTYQTRQKQSILACLEACPERPLTIDELIEKINAGTQKVGRSTVYRYVDKLTQRGLVRKFKDADGKSATYQYVADHTDCDHHIHLKCTACGKFIHLDCKTMDAVNAHILERHHFQVDNSKSLLFGLCEDCLWQQERCLKENDDGID